MCTTTKFMITWSIICSVVNVDTHYIAVVGLSLLQFLFLVSVKEQFRRWRQKANGASFSTLMVSCAHRLIADQY